MKNLKFIVLIAITVLIGGSAAAQITTESTNKLAQQWVKKGEWRNGVKANLHESSNKIEFAKQYHANKAMWDKAFAYLSNPHLDTIAPGKYPIDGDNVFVIVTDGPTKEIDQASWEAHRKYIDLQYVIRGKEMISVIPIEKATVTKPYDATKDVANYTGKGEDYIAYPGTFLLLFPAEVHRPGVKVKGFDVVKKMVVKVKVI
jgi:YhcH/YjgK/YiaL family protein